MKKKTLEAAEYEVVFSYRDPKTRVWKKVGDMVELTKPQAQPLLLGAKPRIKKVESKTTTQAATTKAAKTNKE